MSDDDDHVTIAHTINDQFMKVSSDVPPFDLCVLEAYLPAKEPPPSLLGMHILSSERSNPPK